VQVLDEIEENPWWTDRTRKEMREIGDLRDPHVSARIISRAHTLAPETLVAIIRRLPLEQLVPDSRVYNACTEHLLVPKDNTPATSASVELTWRVKSATRGAFGPLSEDELTDFYYEFMGRYLRNQVLSRTNNRILEERFWYRVHRRLPRFLARELRKRHAASIAASFHYESSMARARSDGVPDSPTAEALLEEFREKIGLWLSPKLAMTVRLWLDGYPISSTDPTVDSICTKLGITREAVSKRLRRAGGLLSEALGRPVVLLRRPRTPGAPEEDAVTEQEEAE
jgi:hypothetical protein